MNALTFNYVQSRGNYSNSFLLLQKLDERGQKLSQLEDKAVLMREGAANFSSNAHELAEKMRGKKWWQL